MGKILIILVFTLVSSFSFGQNFEGEISVVKKTLSDTLYYSYSIKNDKVKVDEYDKYKRLQKSYIINTKDSSLFAINYNQKVYTKVAVDKSHTFPKSNRTVINTGVFKYINGYKCYQWRVRDFSTNTEMAYWVPENNFNFFMPMVYLWNSVEEDFGYYLSLPAKVQGMPLLTESRTLLRDDKGSYSVVSIDKKSIQDSEFEIPATFSFFEAVH